MVTTLHNPPNSGLSEHEFDEGCRAALKYMQSHGCDPASYVLQQVQWNDQGAPIAFELC